MTTFVFLIFLAAFGLEGIGTYVSVIGLSSLFSANPIVMILAVALDFAKVMAVSFLYKFWTNINRTMKGYMTLATLVLMLITSAGFFGFLSGEFQKAIADTGTQSIKIQTLEEEKGRLQKRKEEIDAQIAKVADNNVRGRTQLIKQFGPEVSRVNDRLAAIDKDLPDLKIQNVDKETHVGPIIYIAKAFNTTPEEAVKWIIMTIIFVCDPLAISLLIAGNFLIEFNRRKKEEIPEPFAEPVPVQGPVEITNIAPPSEEVVTKKQIDSLLAENGDQMIAPIILTAPDPAMNEGLSDTPIEEVGKALDKYETEEELTPIPTPTSQPELELLPIEEPAPDCKECDGTGLVEGLDSVGGSSTFETCYACAQPEEEQTIEERAVENLRNRIQNVRSRNLKVEQVNGRDVISLDKPQSSLESVSEKLADILPDNNVNSIQTMKLRNYYTDEIPKEPIKVGGL